MFEDLEFIELTPALKEKYDERLKKFAKDYSRLQLELIHDLYGDAFYEEEFDMVNYMQVLMGILGPYIDVAFDEVIEEMEAEGE